MSLTTSFPLTEDPISQGGVWINGGTTGLNWTNVQTTAGFAFGTESGTNFCPLECYDDSTAVLAGAWGPSQTAEATVGVIDAASVSGIFEEVELRLRTSISADSITGYEINCSVSTFDGNDYLTIVRWNGPLGSWTQIGGAAAHCVSGDALEATISGSTINAYLNGILVETATDTTFSSGSPGIGFYLEDTAESPSSLIDNYGFTNFTATDGLSSAPEPNALSLLVSGLLVLVAKLMIEKRYPVGS